MSHNGPLKAEIRPPDDYWLDFVIEFGQMTF